MTPADRALLRTPLCDLLGCDLPILLAGMGGVSRWELAAAVAGAGGYPTLGMVRESPDLIAAEVRALQAATDRPFAVNLIPAATDPALLEAQVARCLDLGVGAFSGVLYTPLYGRFSDAGHPGYVWYVLAAHTLLGLLALAIFQKVAGTMEERQEEAA